MSEIDRIDWEIKGLQKKREAAVARHYACKMGNIRFSCNNDNK